MSAEYISVAIVVLGFVPLIFMTIDAVQENRNVRELL